MIHDRARLNINMADTDLHMDDDDSFIPSTLSEDLPHMNGFKRTKPHTHRETIPPAPLPESDPDPWYTYRLYGRRVNLLHFEPDASLYSLARAWLRNEPEQSLEPRGWPGQPIHDSSVESSDA
ncbi:unnamed protein product [Cyprideis torosa]|uniref:Uncharacterized protein n=1 Tax=Cyprideis torosa TaxID=163714 RepID=A0A7R8ZMA4_9CRUS|nr:unnamed protein product [Cyprideis torosa]CAG0895130.1 unnamed protein product [Cyprideis torosa]